MKSRKFILITLAALCHLVSVGGLLTLQLHAQKPGMCFAGEQQPARGECALLQARQQEKHGSTYTLRGQAFIHYRQYELHADEIVYNDQTGDANGHGHLVLDGGPWDMHLTASHGIYNLRTDSGRFWDAAGTLGVQYHGKNLILTTSEPFSFKGAVVDKTGPDKLVVNHGWVTSCALPKPKWLFQAKRASIVAGKDAKIHNGVFWVGGFPILYSPYFDQPVERQRKSGFLLPVEELSNLKGTVIGDGFFWAISRSMDATIGGEFYSRRGGSQSGRYEALFSDKTTLSANYYGVIDRGLLTAPSATCPAPSGVTEVRCPQGGEQVRVDFGTTLFQDVRAVGVLDYLSSYLFRAAFGATFLEAISTETRSTAFLTEDRNGYSLNADAARYQNFLSTTGGDVVTIQHLPSLEASSADRSLAGSPFYWGFDTAADSLFRSTPPEVANPPFLVTKANAGRFDLAPHISFPRILQGWSFRPELTMRDTFYTDSANGPAFGAPQGGAGDALNRRALQGRLEVAPPAVSRVFQKTFLNRRWKHTLEPRMSYRQVSGIDNFQSVLRFDERDILNDTEEAKLGLVQRFYAKPVTGSCGTKPPQLVHKAESGTSAALSGPEGTASTGETNSTLPSSLAGPCAAREVLTWELAQKYFFDSTFGGALHPGVLNILESSVDLTGIAFLTERRNWSPLVSDLRMRLGNFEAEWQLDYDPKQGDISSSNVFFNYRFSPNVAFGAGDAVLKLPPEALASINQSAALPIPSNFDQFRLQATYGHNNKRGLSAAGTVGFDADEDFLQYAALESTYNWDCCGMTFEYRRLAIGTVRRENEYRFTFSLANVGNFGNLRKQERLY